MPLKTSCASSQNHYIQSGVNNPSYPDVPLRHMPVWDIWEFWGFGVWGNKRIQFLSNEKPLKPCRHWLNFCLNAPMSVETWVQEWKVSGLRSDVPWSFEKAQFLLWSSTQILKILCTTSESENQIILKMELALIFTEGTKVSWHCGGAGNDAYSHRSSYEQRLLSSCLSGSCSFLFLQKKVS